MPLFFSHCLFISTHSLTRRLTGIEFTEESEDDISTHSLTRRLTITSGLSDVISHISTHSLTRRLTKERQKETKKEAFQLTASQGG